MSTLPSPRILFVQPALPRYRHDFFDRLARMWDGEVQVFYSPADMGSLTAGGADFDWATPIGPVRRLGPGVYWQDGAVSVPIRRGDVVVVSGAPRCLSNLILLLRARLKGAKTVWWGHYWSSTSTASRQALRLALMRAASAVLFYTDAEVAAYKVRTGGRDTRIVAALNNGIDTDPIRSLRHSYDPTTRARAVLFIGRLTNKAGLDLAIRALSHSTAKDIVLHVIGDGAAQSQVQAQAASLGVATRIHWHGGTTDEATIAQVANQVRAFIYPGEVGLSLIHAMAYGLPALLHGDASRQMPEYAAFADGHTGLSFARDNAADLAKQMRDMMDRPDQLAAFSAESLARIDTDYTTKGMAQRILGMIHKLQNPS